MGEAGFTTFLVDDDPAVLRSITRLLNAAGYKTKSFLSPQKFLSAHDPSVPGCAIIDLVMCYSLPQRPRQNAHHAVAVFVRLMVCHCALAAMS